jgi:dienelactone hydrolase
MLRAAAAVLFLLALGVSGCAGGSDDGTFTYDDAAELSVESGSLVEDGPVAVREISYASGDRRVEGYLAAPARASGRLAAAVYLHGAGGDREQLLDLAKRLARRGAVALTLTLPSGSATPPAGSTAEETLRWQHDTIVADVVAVRRAFDLLGDDSRVDADRLGLVGWSFGGRLAALVAGADDRVRATALMSAGAAPVSEYVAAAPAELRDDIEEVLTPIDPLALIAEAEGDVFLQAGRSDSVVPERALRALADAAPEGAKLSWYRAEHDLDERARRDQLEWLGERLEITGPAPGAATGT